jgi:PAS domain S-box-containing protein
MIEDIGESKRMQELLQQDAFRLRSIVENMSVGATHIGRNGSGPAHVFCNRACEEMVGYAREELSTLEAWFELIHGKERAAEMQAKYEEDRIQVGRCIVQHVVKCRLLMFFNVCCCVMVAGITWCWSILEPLEGGGSHCSFDVL